MVGEDEPGQCPRGDRSGVLLGTLDGSLDLAELPCDLLRGERGRLDHLGQEIEAEPEVLPEDAERRADAVASSARLQAAADELDRRVERGSRARRRPAGEQGAGEVREPHAVGGSYTAPASSRTRTATIGTAGRSATSRTMPFGRTSRRAIGAAIAGDASPRSRSRARDRFIEPSLTACGSGGRTS